MMTQAPRPDLSGGLDGVLTLLSQSLRASATVVYWIDATKGSPIAHHGYENAYFERYEQGAGRDDPISFQTVVRQGSRLAFLSQTLKTLDRSRLGGFMHFMSDCGFADAMTFILRDGDRPMIGVGVMKTHDDPPMTEETAAVAQAIQSYLETNLIHHPGIRRHYVDRQLDVKFGLSRREREVVGLIADGASNHDISVVLGISEATVKTHIQRSFDKLGVSSRTATMRMLLQPEHWLRSA